MSEEGKEKPYFIHFGCWNSGLCEKETGNNGLSRVMRALQEEVAAKPPEFMVVAGDNYYPEKQDIKNSLLEQSAKTKTIDVGNLQSGFDCLPTTVPIYMLLGNHDLENINDCQIMKEEQEAIQKNDKIQYIGHGSIDIFGYRVVMIDTNLFSSESHGYAPCYKKFQKNNNKKNVKKMIQQYYVINKTKDKTRIVLIGHHPIDFIFAQKPEKSEKSKKPPGKKKPDAIAITTGLVNLIRTIYSENSLIKDFVYLCADNHYYQASTITLPDGPTIRQFIVGTGGAKLDAVPTDVLQEYVPDNNNNQTTIQVVNQESKHGFAKFSIDGKGLLQCEFVPPVSEAITSPPVGGSRRVRQKRRITIRKKKSSRPERNNRRPV
jgi:hypothetical protein